MRGILFRRPIQVILIMASSALLASIVLSATTVNQVMSPSDAQAEAAFASSYCKTSVKTTVPAGSEAEARKYYHDLSRKIGFQIQDPIQDKPGTTTTLVDVAKYLGFTTTSPAEPLTAQELQDASPADLMDSGAFGKRLGGVPLAPGDVLVARFFAPKISNVSQSSVADAGWRKLLRLRARPGSQGATHGIDYGIILFNFFAPLDRLDPFTGNDSVNTQVILVGRNARKSLYWIDFGKTSGGAQLSHELNAFFDAGHIPASATEENGGATAYSVPCGCISCHGGLRLEFSGASPAPDNHFRAPLLDYLDTDHWQDRTAPGDDFEGLKAPVLFDPSTFSVILLLNQEIQQQNAAAQPDSVLRRAVERWLTSHLQRGPTPEPLFSRALRSSNSRTWNPSDAVDAQLLPALNRYCFRCHGSVLFDVLDKEMVFRLKSAINASLFPRDEIVDQRGAMPPDRDLPKEEFKRLRDLVLDLK
jgi:hypothetical protein